MTNLQTLKADVWIVTIAGILLAIAGAVMEWLGIGCSFGNGGAVGLGFMLPWYALWRGRALFLRLYVRGELHHGR